MAARKGYRKCEGPCGRNRAERFFKPRGRICAACLHKRRNGYSKDVRLQETYGITLQDYERMYAAQGGRCAICQGQRKILDVDHDHKRERALIEQGREPIVAARLSVRGLCCRRCNRRLLPSALDSVDVLQRAIGYLLDPPAQDQLGS